MKLPSNQANAWTLHLAEDFIYLYKHMEWLPFFRARVSSGSPGYIYILPRTYPQTAGLSTEYALEREVDIDG